MREKFSKKALFLIFCGCMFLPLAFAEAVPTADDFLPPEEFHLTVEDAVSYALEHSYIVRSASVDLETKGDTANHILNALFPKIQAGATVARTNYSATAQNEADYWSAMANLSLSLSYNGSIFTDLRKAQDDYRAGLISFEQTQRQVVRDIKKLFYAMLLSQKTLENDRLSLQSTKERWEQAERSYRNGYITRQDFLQTQVSYQNMKRDIENEERAFSEQIDQFAMVLGMKAGSKVILEGELTAEILDFDEYELLKKYGPTNSQYILADLNLQSVEHQIMGLILKTYTPTFSLNYSLKPSLCDFDANWFDSSNWTDAGNLSFTVSWDLSGIFPWSNSKIQERNLRREKEKLEIQKEQITSQLWTDMKKTLDAISSARAAISASEELIEVAQQAYRLTAESYRNGRTDFLTVRDSENQLNKAKIAYQADLYNYISNIIELEYLLNLPEGWAER